MASIEEKLCVLQEKLKETDDNLSVCIVLLQQYLRHERYKKEVCLIAVLAVASAVEEKKEKRGLLGLGYGHGAIAEPLGFGLAGHGLEYSAPIVSAPVAAPVLKAYSAPISYAAPAVSYAAPAVSYAAPAVSYAAPAVSYSAPIISKSIAAPISYSAPLITKSYAAPAIAAPISYGAPLITKSIAAPISYSAPLITKSYAAAPISYGHGLGYSGLSLGYGKLLH